MSLPIATRGSPAMVGKIKELGRAWATAPDRPRIVDTVKRAWDKLLADWIGSDLPLVIRKSSAVRGSELLHRTGRRIIVADNSPAQWAFTRAHRGERYDLAAIRKMLSADQIPFTYIPKTAEKSLMKYKCKLSIDDCVNLPKPGWKLCHVQEIGLSSRTPLEQVELSELHKHCRLLLSPSNHFVVPLEWGGLGEVPEFIEELRTADANGKEASE